ncbi:uncharacterized protein EV420DRAFT_1132510 [Desarmillaria tabescens]|uniref:Fibronectin type-III domain-containing protein n=1 Tax=Armillaria tabescens TaxID=1929756 RepID=A0AA39MNQ7_ARMTA|nr:uncharacterized protein EV420DRAFT_1132510 [Desarmillaria tabescens]KAK0440464.1 hypothetical protein EV420DRAFT_1132510 [Desarmillaria tabescens]
MKFLSVLASLPAAALALTVQVPTNPVSGQVTDIYWTNGPSDPEWTLFLMNASETAFGLKGILGENVDPTPEKLTVTLPVLPETEYRYVLKAVRADNLDWPVAWSDVFDITQPE